MDNPTSLPHSPTPRGIPLWIAGILLLVLAILTAAGCAFMWYSMRSDKAKLERQILALTNQQQRAELERQKGAEDARLAFARTHQNDTLIKVRQATNALETLLHQVDSVRADAAVLKTNEAGRALALHPDLVAQPRRLFESELPQLASASDIIERLEGARRIEQ